MTYQFLKLIHLLSLVLWIGGMVFSHYFLRKPVATLPAVQRFPFMHHVLRRFFNAVAVSAVLVLLSGLWMIGRSARQMSRSGLAFEMPWSWTAMAVLGIIMIAIFGYIRLVLYPRFSRAVKASDTTASASALAAIRPWVAFNMSLGILVIVVAVLG